MHNLTHVYAGLSVHSLHIACDVFGWLRAGSWLEPRTLKEAGSPYFSVFDICFLWCQGWQPGPLHTGPVLYIRTPQGGNKYIGTLVPCNSQDPRDPPASRLPAQQLACICSPQQNHFHAEISPFSLIENNLHVLTTLRNKLLAVLFEGKICS